ncbi:PREDICTED: T-cell surface glycoprotein CD3 gamma chain-like, partial [Leptosomus discolor]|uniref:T-cell surface glycoprotein CD3 gamma chain-like n=1 Tax=Leptosomus discolor TaxID=188344 RepID=UPI000522BF01
CTSILMQSACGMRVTHIRFEWSPGQVIVKEASGKVFLQCATDRKSAITWLKDGNSVGNTTQLDLGAVYDDPRGVYTCKTESGTEGRRLQVYYRTFEDGSTGLRNYRQLLCWVALGNSQAARSPASGVPNCIEVDAPTISGIVIADVVATIFLAVAVYCITGQDKGRMSRASDRQNLIANEQLYQPLGERDDGQYSRLAPAKSPS